MQPRTIGVIIGLTLIAAYFLAGLRPTQVPAKAPASVTTTERVPEVDRQGKVTWREVTRTEPVKAPGAGRPVHLVPGSARWDQPAAMFLCIGVGGGLVGYMLLRFAVGKRAEPGYYTMAGLGCLLVTGLCAFAGFELESGKTSSMPAAFMALFELFGVWGPTYIFGGLTALLVSLGIAAFYLRGPEQRREARVDLHQFDRGRSTGRPI